MQICFASHNANKVKELNHILGGVHEVVSLSELGLSDEIAETGSTFEENAFIKARYVYEKLHIPVFADDSGLIVDALGGEPGVFSARYAGEEKDDEKNIKLLLQNLEGNENRSASFKTVIAFIDHKGLPHQFEGSISGRIVNERRGTNGFGYDPVFQPDGYQLTFAELSHEEKNRISHRAKAVKLLIAHLHQYQ